ncbi:MAG TPA: NAD-dependent epimerase/dehydratase family protein [bacterium]|nr:NAD-dependent epimerase/dehydratase family protein [bacterium]
MKILIIGGTGNISTGITDILIKRGEEVFLYNRGNKKIEGAINIVGDRTRYDIFESQMRELMDKIGRFDCVIDMICYTPPDAESLVKVFGGKIDQLIFCSTVDVYSKPAPKYPIKEDFERKPSISFPYAFNKAICENILEEAAESGKFHLTILRPAATYNDTSTPISLLGPGTALLKRIRDGKPVIVLGDGTSFWTSSHRDDVAVAFANAAGNTRAFNKSYNVTGDEWITWREYYSTVARVMDAPHISFVCIPTDLLGEIAPNSAKWCVENFMFNNILDNSLAKEDLMYKYTITWEDGTRRMINYHNSQGDIDNATEFPLYNLIIERFKYFSSRLVEELSILDR